MIPVRPIATSDSIILSKPTRKSDLLKLRAAIEAAESRRVLLGGRSTIDTLDWLRVLEAAGVPDSVKGHP